MLFFQIVYLCFVGLSIVAKRLKQLREEMELTQVAFAEKLGIATTADLERGRTKLSGKIAMQLLRDFYVNPLWLFGESEQKYLNPNDHDVLPKTITTDQEGNENILLVNEKVAAGYADNLENPEYYESLPSFAIPLPEYHNSSFRAFQVEGYSMSPAILPGEWVFAKALSNINEIASGHIYIVVEEQGIRVKKVINNTDDHTLSLISFNPDYPTDTIGYNRVKELWEFHSKLSREIDVTLPNEKLNAIHKDIRQINEQINALKKN